MESVISMYKVAEQMTIKVRVTKIKRWRLRLWLGIHLFELAAKIMRMGIVVEIENIKEKKQ